MREMSVQELADNGEVNAREERRKQEWGKGAANATSDKGNIPGGRSSLLKTTTPESKCCTLAV
jgi:hypothetical protein